MHREVPCSTLNNYTLPASITTILHPPPQVRCLPSPGDSWCAYMAPLLLKRLTTIILNKCLYVYGGFIASVGVGVGKLENCPITNTYKCC